MERWALSGTFSRHIVVFRSEIVLLYTDDWRDLAANALKLGGPALSVVHSFATACAAPDQVNDVIEQLVHADGKRMSRLRLDRVTSARLNLGPLAGAPTLVGSPAKLAVKLAMSHVPFGTSLVNVDALSHELIIKAVAPERNKGTGELWFGAGRSEPLEEIKAMMREALGGRFAVHRYPLPPNLRPHLPKIEWR
jgi:hypothetical protein